MMRHNPFVKFMLILLAVVCLTGAVAGVAGVVVMAGNRMYTEQLPQLYENWLQHAGYVLARSLVRDHLSQEVGNCPQELVDTYLGHMSYETYDYHFTDDNWHVTVVMEGKTIVDTGCESIENSYTITDEFKTSYLTADTKYNGTDFEHTLYENGEAVTYWLKYIDTSPLQATVNLDASVLDGTDYGFLIRLYDYRYAFLWLSGISLLLLVLTIFLLCRCAGQRKDGSVRPGGLNRLPLDVYTAATAGLTALLLRLITELWQGSAQIQLFHLVLTAWMVFAISLLLTLFVFALAAQIKAKEGFWWRHSAVGFVILKLYALAKWVWKWIGRIGKLLLTWIRMWPVMGQWMTMAYGGLVASLLILLFAGLTDAEFFAVISAFVLLASVGMALYCGWCFGTLLSGVEQMAQGNLYQKIPTEHLHGVYWDFAQQLNALSETAVTAAQKQMRSERMKTELITNVSHDIKTPLTSIINFVDLLQKPHTEEEEREYLEVLSRQSERMKKLLEDLMEMSKASTGNVAASIEKLDAVETVNQALGEFADKLVSAQLNPVFRQPDAPVYIYADGRLTWRVLSNVLSNTVKYALPGTRVYVDLVQLEGEVLLSVKNISREELRLTADELMERFVQGDASRNSEGSGLGLNIARSLMEVQHGQLQLLLDGDLFKVTLVFPAAQ